MSRAFVKEVDEAPDIADRPISDAPNYLTQSGAAMIERALASIEEKLAGGVSEAEAPALRRELSTGQPAARRCK